MSGKWFYLCLVVMWCVIIFLFSQITYFSGDHTAKIIKRVVDHTPLDVIPNEIQYKKSDWLKNTNYIVRKSSHVIVFAILALFIWKAFHRLRFSYIFAWIMTTLYAVIDEWHQSFIPWRTSLVSDVIIDSSAAFVMLLIVFIVNKKKKKPALYLLADSKLLRK